MPSASYSSPTGEPRRRHSLGRTPPLPGHLGNSRLAPIPDFARRAKRMPAVANPNRRKMRMIVRFGFMRARTRGANGRRGDKKGRGFSGAVLTGGKRAFRLFPVLLAAVAFAAPVAAGDSPPAEWRIVDGDTLAWGDERVRLCAVDTPERGKAGAAAATGAMRGLLRGAGGTVRVAAVGVDRFGRTVGRVFIGEVDAQVFLLVVGLARTHPRFADACAPAGLSAAELRAAANPDSPLWNAGGR